MTDEERKALALVADRLGSKFPEQPRAGIATLIDRVHHQYDGRPVRTFVPVLVEREVTDRLGAASTS